MNEKRDTYQFLVHSTLGNTQYFKFEEDFVAENVRCIPMIVRMKLDTVGIKLKLAEWGKFSVKEKINLAIKIADSKSDQQIYRDYICQLVEYYTANKATEILVDSKPDWIEQSAIPSQLLVACKEYGFAINLCQWKLLSNLQRFALLKLCRPGHENRNFPKAMEEFNLTS